MSQNFTVSSVLAVTKSPGTLQLKLISVAQKYINFILMQATTVLGYT